jgi:hypothetical protein
MGPMKLLFAVVATLAIVAAGTIAAATTRSLQPAKALGASINPFELMMNSKDLPSPQYGEPF